MRPHLLSLARELRALPGSSNLTVFGSMLERPDTAGDLDVAWPRSDNLDQWSPEVRRQVGTMLNLGAYGSPYYGSLDLFVPTPSALLVRDELGRSLTVANNARALRQAIGAGEPFTTWYDREVVPRLERSADPVPTRQELIQAARDAREADARRREAEQQARREADRTRQEALELQSLVHPAAPAPSRPARTAP